MPAKPVRWLRESLAVEPPAVAWRTTRSQTKAMTPDPAPVLDLIEAFRRSKVLFAAVSLGIFDLLENIPSDHVRLAAALGVQAEPLERLLDTCVGLKLLRRNQTRYENEPISSTYLCRAGEHSLTGYILYSNDVLFRLWDHLEDAVREGAPRWQQVFHSDGPIFDQFFRTEEAKQVFLQGMHGFGLLSSPKVVAAFDLGTFHHLVDLGGGTGHLAVVACELYPHLRATVFDLPQTVKIAESYVRSSKLASGRVSVVAGDFFSSDLPAADVFALGRILHDWSDEKVAALLGKIYDRLPSRGGILIAEKLLNENKSGPVSAQLQSLNMLVCTEGKERSLMEYRGLLEKAGFRDVEGKITGAPLDAIFARKP
jgi:acetylserotonin O-methyltransferase